MADKTLKSLNFGGADNYFPLPIVSTNNNDNILIVADGEWVAKSPNDITGQYVWSKKDSADGPVTGYVISNDGEKYPDGGWSDGVFYTLELEPMPLSYLSFLGNEDFTLKTANTTKNWDGTLEYSTDTSTWNTWNGEEISSAGSKLYFRGTGNTKITGNSNNYRFVFTGTDALKIACKGNIENLLDYETVSAGGHPTMANYCYSDMFYGCTSLTSAPALPATTLAAYCYRNMFYGCTSLTTAPDLPATTLTGSCYTYMFGGCEALTTAPELPATKLVNKCYSNMFLSCKSLTTAPALPATTLGRYCYNNMFYGCKALTTAPELPATTLTEGCYYGMFVGCRNIKLSTTQTGEYQKAYRIPTSGTGTTATDALTNMFANTGGTFKGTPSINTTYYTSNTVV